MQLSARCSEAHLSYSSIFHSPEAHAYFKDGNPTVTRLLLVRNLPST